MIFKASALWADAFYKLKCPYVCLFVCLSVHHTLSLSLTVFLPPLPNVQCPNFLDFWNPWGKIIIINGLRFETKLLIKGVKLPRKKKVCFWANFALLSRIFWYRCFSLRLPVFLPPLPEVQYPNFLDIWNPWIKVVLDCKTFAHKGCKIAAQIFSSSFFQRILPS